MLLDLPSRQDFEALSAKLDAMLQLLQTPAKPAADELLTLEQVAAYTKFDSRTVKQWVKAGRFDKKGKKVYLPVYQFSDLLRFKRSDVDAFGQGIGVLEATDTGEAQPAKKSKKAPAVDSKQALRVA